MPKTCCVPGCKSNYHSTKEKYITVFKFPTNSELRNKWIQCIPRIDWSPTPESVVCRKHFQESDIRVSDTYTDKYGVVHVVPRDRPSLKPDAYPTIFPDLSEYHLIQAPIPCKDPKKRNLEIVKNHKENNSKWELQDFINDFEDLKLNVIVNLKSLLERPYKHCVIEGESCCYMMFYTISVETDSAASISVTVKIFPDMSVLAFVGNEVVSQKNLEWVLEKNKVNTWSQLENLLVSYKETSPTNTLHNVNGKEQTFKQDGVKLKTDAVPVLFPAAPANSKGLLRKNGKKPRLSASSTDNNSLNGQMKQVPDVEIGSQHNTTSINPSTGQSKANPYIEKNGGNLLAASCTQSEEISSFDSQTQKKPDEKGKEAIHFQVVGSGLTKFDIVKKNLRNCVIKILKCDLCGDTFVRFNNLKSHLRSHFAEKLQKCDICNYTCVLFNDLMKHKDMHAERMYQCHLCGASFFYLESLKAHYGENDVDKPCWCDICGVMFLRVNCLRSHTKIHSGNKIYKCDICGASRATSEHLDKHKRIHSIEKSCKCDICGDVFVTDGAVLKHKKEKHSVDRPYMCEICGRSYFFSQSLIDHQKNHTGERPYKCKICGKASKRLSELKSHNKIHTGEKPFLCNFCGVAFQSSYRLKVHIRRHAGEKPYKCGICSASFVDSTDCNRHKKTHNGERRYRCDTCGAPFKRLDYLKAHKKKHIKKASIEL